jgi:hypothetical protein
VLAQAVLQVIIYRLTRRRLASPCSLVRQAWSGGAGSALRALRVGEMGTWHLAIGVALYVGGDRSRR